VSGPTLNAELAQYLREIDAIKQEGEALVRGVDDDRLNQAPEPGRWSVAQHLDHLVVGLCAVLPAIDRTLADAERRGLRSNGPFRYGWFSRMMVRSMEPPVTRRWRTQRIFMPADRRTLAEVLPAFLAAHDQLAERVRNANGLDLKRAVVVSPASWLFRLSLGAYIAFLCMHSRRHLWHVRQTLARSSMQP
jgi:DinB family protein